MATDAEILMTLKLLRRNFTEWGKGQTEREIQESYRLYIDRLRHLPTEFIQLAALKHIDTEKFFPKISELLQPAEAIMRAEQERISTIERNRFALDQERKREAESGLPVPHGEVVKLMQDLSAKLAENKMRRDRQRKEASATYAEQQKAIARRIVAEEKPEEVEE